MFEKNIWFYKSNGSKHNFFIAWFANNLEWYIGLTKNKTIYRNTSLLIGFNYVSVTWFSVKIEMKWVILWNFRLI